MQDTRTPPSLGRGLPLQLVAAALLSAAAWVVWDHLRRPEPAVFWVAVAVPIVHQLFVWLAWRLELNGGVTARTIGFGGYVACFFVFFIGRFVSLAALAWLDRGSLGLGEPTTLAIAAVLAAPGLYAVYSVKRYFGLWRAAGADHFDPAYRSMPQVKEGIFRFTSNGMYIYVFLLFWAIAIGLDSSAALIVAALSHALIWVHFFATEKPDMEYLYGNSEPTSGN